MTLEELKEKAKEMLLNTRIGMDSIIVCGTFWFDKDGDFGISNEDGSYKIVAYNRTPEQMLMIMRGLE